MNWITLFFNTEYIWYTITNTTSCINILKINVSYLSAILDIIYTTWSCPYTKKQAFSIFLKNIHIPMLKHNYFIHLFTRKRDTVYFSSSSSSHWASSRRYPRPIDRRGLCLEIIVVCSLVGSSFLFLEIRVGSIMHLIVNPLFIYPLFIINVFF